MYIREAELSDQLEVTELYQRSQFASGLPDPRIIAPQDLGNHLYARNAIRRYVAIETGRIVGHGLIEQPNQENIPLWQPGLSHLNDTFLIELGGAFVEPQLSGKGYWTALLEHRLTIIRSMDATPVSCTWSQNEHVKRTFKSHGGVEVGQRETAAGTMSLFVF